MKHGHSRRRTGVTIGRPCVEWEECPKNTETDEDNREEDVLNINWNVVQICYLNDIHGLCTTIEEDGQNTYDEQSGATHKHKGELHCCILLGSTTPYTNEQVHRDKRNLIEHEHSEEVDGDKESKDTRRKQYKPEEILLLHRLHLP